MPHHGRIPTLLANVTNSVIDGQTTEMISSTSASHCYFCINKLTSLLSANVANSVTNGRSDGKVYVALAHPYDRRSHVASLVKLHPEV